jgi:hypothetical protein
MAFSLADIEHDFESFLGVLDKVAQIVVKLAPIAAAIAPVTGGAAPAVIAASDAAAVISRGVDVAYQAHESAGQTPASAIAALTTVANAVASSGVVNAAVANKITTVTQALDPRTIEAMTQA